MLNIKVGDKIGKLTVQRIYKVDDQYRVTCQCDCGNEVYDTSLNWLNRSSHSHTCGECYKYEMIGKRFGNLVVTNLAGVKRYGSDDVVQLYKCKCDCGGEVVLSGKILKKGDATKCGKCLENTIVGKVINNWTILSIDHKDDKGRLFVKARCSCGNEKVISASDIKGRTNNCDRCYHGLYKSNEPEIHRRCVYLSRVYSNIVSRCQDPNNISFYNYGGRGIQLSISRINFIKKFYLYNDDNFYRLQIDRIDNNGDYEDTNIRLVSSRENCDNRLYKNITTYEEIASRLMSVVTFRNLDMISNMKINENEFVLYKFPLKTKGGNQLGLYIHKSIDKFRDSYIDKVIHFYKVWGKIISKDDVLISEE